METTQNINNIAKGISHVELAELKETIGRGFVVKVCDYLKKKTKKRWSENYVRRSLTMDYLHPKILMYALELATEIKKENEESLLKANQFLSEQRAKYTQD